LVSIRTPVVAPGTTYTIHVTTGVQDVAGNSLASEFTSSFTTMTYLIGETFRVSVDSAGNQGNDWSEQPSISADGRYVAFVSDANNLVSGGHEWVWGCICPWTVGLERLD